jgi:hypothetical protein
MRGGPVLVLCTVVPVAGSSTVLVAGTVDY